MSRAWMPLYVADYLADTGHLTTAEHGAYLLLIMHYWSNGGLPDDERKLARIARMTPDEWADAAITLKGFFSDGWRHKRIEAEFERATEKSSKAAASANTRWMRTHSNRTCEGNANAMLPQPQPHIDTNVSIDASPKPKRAKAKTKLSEDAQPTERDKTAASEAGLSESAFREHWRKFRDYHTAHGSLMADWQAAWRTWLSNISRFQARAGPPQDKGGFASMLINSVEAGNGQRQNAGHSENILTLPVAHVASGEREAGHGGGVS